MSRRSSSGGHRKGGNGVKIMSFASLKRSPVSDSALLGECRDIAEFERLNRLGEGAYGIVYRAQDVKTKAIVAVKRVKMAQENGGLPISSLREISALRNIHHENVVQLQCVAVGIDLSSVFLVMEYCEHDLATLLDNVPAPFPEPSVKCLMLQLIRGIGFLHDKCIIHRDVKLSNLLLNDKGILKICDFGLARPFGDSSGALSPMVVTLWYRAPELLLGEKKYTTSIDTWAVGCIFGELLQHSPLMPGKREAEQMSLIIKLIGAPNDNIWPGYSQLPLAKLASFHQDYSNLREKFHYLSSSGIDLLHQFLTYDPRKRLRAQDAWKHPYFGESPLPVTPDLIPTFPHHRNRLD